MSDKVKKNSKDICDTMVNKLRNRGYTVSQKTAPKVKECSINGELFMWEVICVKVPLKEYSTAKSSN